MESIQPEEAIASPHDGHCFIVMPYGRTPEEIRWFRGWYRAVIEPAVRSAGYEPVLAADQESPMAINDEIRAHLAYDPMVVVDLGGVSPDMEPNPNVMYELGIRHALNLPVVMLAWRDQRLPFDINNQRVVMEQRDFLEIETNKEKLVSFILAAAKGNFYRPMVAVGRTAALEFASTSLDRDSVLRALVQEVRDLREAQQAEAQRAEAHRAETQRAKRSVWRLRQQDLFAPWGSIRERPLIDESIPGLVHKVALSGSNDDIRQFADGIAKVAPLERGSIVARQKDKATVKLLFSSPVDGAKVMEWVQAHENRVGNQRNGA